MVTRSSPARLFLVATATLASWLVSGAASAVEPPVEPPEEPYVDEFNGSFVEYGVRGGRSAAFDGSASGWTLDAGLRQAFPFLLGDTRLAYRYDDLGAIAGLEGDVSAHGLGLNLGYHPFYLLLLGGGWWNYVISSYYVDLGLGAHYVTLDQGEAGSQGDLGMTWSLGSGLDIPLSHPNRGWAPWINVLYRYQRGDLDLDDGSEVDLHLHTLFVGLSLRINGLLL